MFNLLSFKKIIINLINKILINLYYLRGFKNSLKISLNNNINNFYIPNLSIRNIILIDPNKIKYRNSIPMKFKRRSSPFILDFDWEKNNVILSNFEKENYKYVTCKELFIDGLEIKKCKEYFFMKTEVEKKGEYRNCKNEKDIVYYFNRLFRLFKSIKKNGILKNTDNNIECIIDRNKNLIKIGGGNHRLAIARILNLRLIPVEIKLIHTDFFKGNNMKKIKYIYLNNFLKIIEKEYQ